MLDQNKLKTSMLVLILSLFPFSAYAASTNTGTVVLPLYIALGITLLAIPRRESVSTGGWLFYYYLQLYITLLLTLILLTTILGDLQPAGWEDKTLYKMFVMYVVPALLIKLIETLIRPPLVNRK